MCSDTSIAVGIVGLGHFGHLHADRLVEYGVNLVGGMDIDPAARERFAKNYDVSTTENADELFDAAEAIVIATPNRYHELYTIGALEADLDVLVEKPLAHTLNSAERIAAAADAADGFCMVGFKNGFLHPVEMLRGLRREGRLGDIYHIEANYVRRRNISLMRRFTEKRVAGGGSLIDVGVHAIDLSLSVLGFPTVIEVVGTTRSPFDSRDDASIDACHGTATAYDHPIDDSASAFVRCDDGSTVSLEIAWATNRQPERTFEIRGTDASAHIDLDTRRLQLYESGINGTTCFADVNCGTPPTDGFAAQQQAFLQAIEQDEELARNTVEHGLTVQRVVDAIYRSSKEQRAVQPAQPEV